MSMPSENVIHIKLDYMEALKAKRSVLSAEMSSLRIAKIINKYKATRTDELASKFKVYSRIKDVKTNIKKLQGLLPNPKIPKIIKKEEVRESWKRKTPEIQEAGAYGEGSIESQLREIQRRLERLQREKI